MRITKNQLRQIIKEELAQTLVDEGIVDTVKGWFGGGEKDTLEKVDSDKAELERQQKDGEIDNITYASKAQALAARQAKLKAAPDAFSADTEGAFGKPSDPIRPPR